MSIAKRISYLVVILIFVGITVLHLPTLFLTLCFTSFVLHRLPQFTDRRWTAAIFLVGVTVLAVGSFYFLRHAWREVPKLVETLIPAFIDLAQKYEIDLPFSDITDFGEYIKTFVAGRIGDLGLYAKDVTMEVVELIIGLVAALSLYVDSRFSLETDSKPGSLYSSVWVEVMNRFRTFFDSFKTVMGAQMIISGINTGLTALFLLWEGFPYAVVIIPLTFLCGLVPIIGNIMSNTVIVGVGLTLAPKVALMALLFLVVLHKLEYFLNSKIIGKQIKNPMWLTILGLLIGEALMGLPGMVMAPILLHYVKAETSKIMFGVGSSPMIEETEPTHEEKPKAP